MIEGTREHKILTLTNRFCNELSNSMMRGENTKYYLAEQMISVMNLILQEDKTIPLVLEEQYKEVIEC